eukprot:Gregarina_sp_Pseudo_9__5513@NODE_717_length_2317_cov_16_750658_g674_i0_p1_GENE_NODE_717_length_2317_cov_16_750658_g674_i0NODE_717_length_2317_cov_16_750658_g674_i0_p1_ORF_typecomplete_len680_score145_29Mur_ligase_M/PF08245_12/1_8e18Mur_ligase_C/PF02875_21/0_007_NODE_717_length_2317_cov_16_750658_g674_i0562095
MMKLDVLREELNASIASYARLKCPELEPLRSDYDESLPFEFVSAVRGLYAVSRAPEKCTGEHLQRLIGFRLEHLGECDLALKFVCVGGTNGKGSVATKVAHGLRAMGHRVGLMVSPHLLSVRERCVVDGCPIRIDEWLGIHAFLKRRAEIAHCSFSWFETLTLLACLYFWLRKCEFAVCEVGLGGRKDPTTIFPSKELSIITSIGYDHMDLLGCTREAIAREKAAIIKQSGICLLGPTCRDLSVFRQVQNATLVFSRPQPTFQEENETLARLAIGFLLNSVPALSLSLPDAPARFQSLGLAVGSHIPVILDVGHNVSAMEQLARVLRIRYPKLKHLKVMAAISKKRKLEIFDPLLSVVGASHTECVYLPCTHEFVKPWGENLNDNSASWNAFSSGMRNTPSDKSLRSLVTHVLLHSPNMELSASFSPDDGSALIEPCAVPLSVQRNCVCVALITGSFFSVAEVLSALGVPDPASLLSTPAKEVEAVMTTDSETGDCSRELWTFRYESARKFTQPVPVQLTQPHRAKDESLLNINQSVFFVSSYSDRIAETLRTQPNSVWYQLDSSVVPLAYPESQRLDLVEGNWAKTLQVLMDYAPGEISLRDYPETEQSSSATPMSDAVCSEAAGYYSEGVDVYVEGTKSEVMQRFMNLVARGLGSLTGSKRKYVEEIVNMRRFKLTK